LYLVKTFDERDLSVFNMKRMKICLKEINEHIKHSPEYNNFGNAQYYNITNSSGRLSYAAQLLFSFFAGNGSLAFTLVTIS